MKDNDNTDEVMKFLNNRVKTRFNEQVKGGSDNHLFEMKRALELALNDTSEFYDIDNGILMNLNQDDS